MCDCKSAIEKKLTERFQEEKPSFTEHKVELQGFGHVVLGGEFRLMPFMEFEKSGCDPKKNIDKRLKKQRGNMFFSFCPFCGVELK